MVDKFGEYVPSNLLNEKDSPESQKNDNLDSKKPTMTYEQIGKINFGCTGEKDEDLVSYLNKNSDGNDSIEGALAQNEQIQLLLSEVLSDYKNYIGTDKEKLKVLIGKEEEIAKKWLHEKNEETGEQTGMIESMYQYMLENDNQLGFENFIKQNSINIIRAYISNHVNTNGEISFCSKNEIKARLKIDWFINLYKGYREEHAENEEALSSLEHELKQFDNVAKYVKNSIDNGIKKHLLKEYNKEQLAQYLDNFLLGAKENKELKNFLDGKDKNGIIRLIRYGIKEYARLLDVSDGNVQLNNTGDGVFDMQIRCYLYLYGRLSHSKEFNPDAGKIGKEFDYQKGLDDNELSEILRSILITDGFIKSTKEDENNKYLKSEENLRKTQVEEDAEKRRAAWENRINSIQNQKPKYEGGPLQEKNKTLDIQNASGVEISQSEDLGSKISGFDRKDKQSETDNLPLRRPVLMETGKKFIVDNQGFLSKYLNIDDIVKFFNVGENGVSFNNKEWENFENDTDRDIPELDKIKIKNTLQGFPGEYESNLEKAKSIINEKKDQAHETVKNYAIGAVIDNIKDMFQNIVDTNNTGYFINGFEFNDTESAKIENHCLLLSGKFNGEPMNVKYDLNTGKLYMNSFINEDEVSNNIIITGSTEPKFELGELMPFDSVLYEFYKAPTESMNNNVFSKIMNAPIPNRNQNISGGDGQESKPTPRSPVHKMSEIRNKIKEEHKIKFQKMCGTKLDEISWKIKDKVESKSIREPIALKLLKSLGIMPEFGDYTTKNLTGGSDLNKIVQLITTQKNTVEDINTFSNYMGKLMDYIGLNRGEDIGYQDKTREKSKIIFNENYKQENIGYIRESSKYFSREYGMAKATNQFDGNSNFGILKIIEDKFTEGEYPNRKLSNQKINEFEKGIDSDILNVQYEENVKRTERMEKLKAEGDLMEELDKI